jgi:MFS family permease
VRLFTGKLSDRIGRRQSLIIGVSLLIVSMLVISLASNIFVYTLASIIFGLATGVNSPSLFAWTADLSDVKRRGVGAGTMFIALEVGIMTGSFLTLFIYNNTYKSASNSFLIGLVSSTIALIYLVYQIRNKASKY